MSCQFTELTVSKVAQENLCQINTIISNKLESANEALEKMSKDHSQSQDHILKLHKEVRRLCTKVVRAPGQHAHAVEAAISKATNDFEADAWRIRRPNGRIKNWVRNLSCKLISIQHLPALQTPGAIFDILQAVKFQSPRLWSQRN